MDDITKKQQEIFDKLKEICEELNWAMGVVASDEPAPGVVIGEKNFVSKILEHNGEDFELYVHDIATDGMHELPTGNAYENKKKNTYH